MHYYLEFKKFLVDKNIFSVTIKPEVKSKATRVLPIEYVTGRQAELKLYSTILYNLSFFVFIKKIRSFLEFGNSELHVAYRNTPWVFPYARKRQANEGKEGDL